MGVLIRGASLVGYLSDKPDSVGQPPLLTSTYAISCIFIYLSDLMFADAVPFRPELAYLS